MPRTSKWFRPLRNPHQNPLCTPPVPIRAICPAHLILLDLITRIIFGKSGMQTVFNSTLYVLRHLVIRNVISIHKLFYLCKIRSTLAGTLNFLVQTLNLPHLASTSSDCYVPNICPRTWNFIRPQQSLFSDGVTFSPRLFTAIVYLCTYILIHFFINFYMFIYIYIWKNFLFIDSFFFAWTQIDNLLSITACCSSATWFLSVRLSRYSSHDYKHS